MHANRNVAAMISGAVTATALFCFSSTGFAGEVKVTSGPMITPVVELYTSEGCSSCPPADEWVTRLGETLNSDFHAVPLAFHVDYWNRLGWPDPYSDKAFTKRQQEHAVQNRQRSIYTPEFLVSGEETRGTKRVVEAIASANEQLAQVMITYGIRPDGSGSGVIADMLITNPVEGAPLFVVVYENNIVREIGGGENKGRTLRHDFVVRHFEKVETLDAGSYEGRHNIMIGEDWNADNLGFAAVVFDPDNGATLQALRTPLQQVLEKGSDKS